MQLISSVTFMMYLQKNNQFFICNSETMQKNSEIWLCICHSPSVLGIYCIQQKDSEWILDIYTQSKCTVRTTYMLQSACKSAVIRNIVASGTRILVYQARNGTNESVIDPSKFFSALHKEFPEFF